MAKEFNGDDRFFRSPTRRTGQWCARSPKDPARPTTRRRTTKRKPRREAEAVAKREAAEEAATSAPVSSQAMPGARPTDARRRLTEPPAMTPTVRSIIRNLRKEYRAGQPVLRDVSLDRRGPRPHRDHRPVRHRQVDADPLHQPPGRPDLRRDPVPADRTSPSSADASCARRGAASAWCSRSTIWSNASP